MMAWVGAMAQKSYVYISAHNTSYLTIVGDLPEGLSKYNGRIWGKGEFGELINKLAQNGFEVDFMSDRALLFSKKSSSPASAISRAKSDDGEEAYEVARYNLQGVPVSKNEKGVQIIVYSNYTTKTVIVE